MYIDRNKLSNYPFRGYFYSMVIDETLPLDQQKEQKKVFFETNCDIVESTHSMSRNFIWAKYTVYFPFDKEVETIKVKLGDLFEADMYGLVVNGKVVGVFPSQLGGVTVYIQDTDV